MTRQRVLVAVAVWLAVVAGVSALVWVVISRAGDDLVASGRTVVTADPAGSSARADGGTATPTRRPSRRPSSTSSPSASPSATPSASPTDATEPGEPGEPSSAPSVPAPPNPTSPSGGDDNGDGGGSTGGGTGGGTGATTPPASPRRTWQGEPGTVVATCVAGRARLVSAQPATGFHAEVHEEDTVLAVEFEGREESSGTHLTLVARCVGGVPRFSTQSESSGDD